MREVKCGSVTVSCACCEEMTHPEEEILLISLEEFKTYKKEPCPPHKNVEVAAPARLLSILRPMN